MTVSEADRTILRELAEQQAEIAPEETSAGAEDAAGAAFMPGSPGRP